MPQSPKSIAELARRHSNASDAFVARAESAETLLELLELKREATTSHAKTHSDSRTTLSVIRPEHDEQAPHSAAEEAARALGLVRGIAGGKAVIADRLQKLAAETGTGNSRPDRVAECLRPGDAESEALQIAPTLGYSRDPIARAQRGGIVAGYRAAFTHAAKEIDQRRPVSDLARLAKEDAAALGSQAAELEQSHGEVLSAFTVESPLSVARTHLTFVDQCIEAHKRRISQRMSNSPSKGVVLAAVRSARELLDTEKNPIEHRAGFTPLRGLIVTEAALNKAESLCDDPRNVSDSARAKLVNEVTTALQPVVANLPQEAVLSQGLDLS